MSVTLHTTKGPIKIHLFWEKTPKTCKNFLALCASDYYNGTIFHRLLKGFILQGGDPTGTGKGGESIYGGAFPDEIDPELTHSEPGMVSMANSGPDTNKSQFFFTFKKIKKLNGKYTLFGKIVEGLDVLKAYEDEPVDDNDKPLNELKIEEVTIHANPIADMEQD
mmetsp:Transcript_46679/g.53839  ORF Transcript_46679/g.53839 Transcript_46679/m.53839 type:complete len:165 (-) Transcript_46679:204-698(-)